MAKMIFAKSVRYKGITYPPNTQFEVLDEEVQDLKTAGGWVIEEPKAEKVEEEKLLNQEGEEIEGDEEVPSEAPEEEVEEERSEVEILRERAIELGIDFKGNWGVPKLTEAIKEAEQA